MKDFIEFSLPSFIRTLPAVVVENLQILETVRTMLRFWLDFLFNLNKLFNVSVFQFLQLQSDAKDTYVPTLQSGCEISII